MFRLHLLLALLLFLLDRTQAKASLCAANNSRPCYCDRMCAEFRDCCPSAMPDGIKQWPASISKGPVADCQNNFVLRLAVKHLLGESCQSTYVYVFNKCPEGFQDPVIRQQCEALSINESLIYEMPVASRDGKLFRNRFCAICNSYPNTDPPQVKTFESRVDFSKTKLTKEQVRRYIQKGYITILFGVATEAVRNCYPNEIATCPSKTASALVVSCKRGPTARISCGGRLYRNEACASCSQMAELSKCNRSPTICADDIGSNSAGYDFSGLFDMFRLLGIPTQAPNNTTTTTNDTNTNNTAGDVRQTVTIVLSSLSIVALAILLLVYALLPPFHTFAGLMTATLASCLLLAYLAFLVSMQVGPDTVACRVVGHLVHTAFLTSFTWMAVMAFDLLRCFRGTGAGGGRSSQPWRRYAKYSALGWGVPLLIAAICVVLDVVCPDSSISPRFGQPRCYFNHAYGLLVWMIVPVAIVLAFNCIILVFLCRFFHKTASDTKNVRRHAKRGMLFLSVKITLILGVVWIFQVIGVFVRNETLNFGISILTGLQGLAIALAFILTKQTKKNVKTSLSRTQTTTTSVSRAGASRITNSKP